MSDPGELLRGHLGFWGAVCRSISHEMNNVTAILIELAGLMQDRLAAAGGQAVDGQKTAATLGRMGTQLERARRLMGLLNRFGHSVDDFDTSIEVSEAVEQALALCRRFADLKKCELESEVAAAGRYIISGSPFVLLHILFRALRAGLEQAPAGTQLLLRATAAEQGCCFEVIGATPTGDEVRLLEQLVVASGGRLLDQPGSFWLPARLRFPGA